ncbi:MAG TPA: 50S ribosomal protein L24 [Sinorhizobium sp.]|nr:50S ribosomal protein L24 [Sinorhizobium sp.]
MPGTKIRKDDIVEVIAGKDRGRKGRVLQVDRKRGRVLVEHVMMAKKHVRPNPQRQIKGGIAEREMPVHLSNVMLVASGKRVRIGTHVAEDGRRRRIGRKAGEEIDLG